MINLSNRENFTQEQIKEFVTLAAQEMKSGRNDAIRSRNIWPCLYGNDHVLVLGKIYHLDEIRNAEMLDFDGRIEIVFKEWVDGRKAVMCLSPASAFMRNKPGEEVPEKIYELDNEFRGIASRVVDAVNAFKEQHKGAPQ